VIREPSDAKSSGKTGHPRGLGPRAGSARLSVIVPTLDAATYLPELLASLAAQRQPAHEVIAIDGYSTDATIAILESFTSRLPLRIEQRPREGIYAAWNAGLELASNDLCYVACADDLVYPDAFEVLARMARVAPDVHLYTWPVRVIDNSGKRVSESGSPIVRLVWRDWADRPHQRCGLGDAITTLAMGSPYLSMMGVAFSRELWQATGGFSQEYGPAGDVEWQVRAAPLTDVAYYPRSLAAWRSHPSSATSMTSQRDDLDRWTRIISAYLDGALEATGLTPAARQAARRRLLAIHRQSRSLVLANRFARHPDPGTLALLIRLASPSALATVLWLGVGRFVRSRRDSPALAAPASALVSLLRDLDVPEPMPLPL